MKPERIQKEVAKLNTRVAKEPETVTLTDLLAPAQAYVHEKFRGTGQSIAPFREEYRLTEVGGWHAVRTHLDLCRLAGQSLEAPTTEVEATPDPEA